MKHNIIAFCCENAVNNWKIKDVKIVKLPCSGRIDVLHIIKAFEKGYDGVLIFACYEGACKFLSGNIKIKNRIKYAKKILKEININEDRVEMHHLQLNQEEKLRDIIKNFKNKILGG